MEPTTFEGTWEEIAQHAPELAGRRVRVIVLDEPSPPVMLDRALAPLIERAAGLARSQPPAPAPVDGWTEALAEKYRRQGFKL